MSTGAAAKALNVTPQTVRDWIRAGRLKAGRAANGRFSVDAASVEMLAGSRSSSAAATPADPALADILRALRELQAQELASARLLEAVERERDRYRAEASAMREAALQLSAAASETDAGVRHLLEVLGRQRQALVQVLTPNSPEELMP